MLLRREEAAVSLTEAPEASVHTANIPAGTAGPEASVAAIAELCLESRRNRAQ